MHPDQQDEDHGRPFPGGYPHTYKAETKEQNIHPQNPTAIY